jgi:hypothetical protein
VKQRDMDLGRLRAVTELAHGDEGRFQRTTATR